MTDNHERLEGIDERILERIRKLLNMSKDKGCSDGEVDNAMAAVHKLLKQHDLDLKDVILNEDPATVVEVIDRVVYERNQWVRRHKHIAAAVCKLCDVEHYYSYSTVPKRTGGYTQRRQVHFVGLATDVAIAGEMLRYLIAVSDAMARLRHGPKWGRDHNMYVNHFTYRLYERARELKKSASQASADTTAIVLRKDLLIKEYTNTLNLKTSRSNKNWGEGNTNPTQAINDANRVDLGTDNRINQRSGERRQSLR